MSDTVDPCCRTCMWWSEGAPPTATATRNIAAEPDIGTCEYAPPAVVMMMGRAFSYFPETAGDRHCGAWECLPGDDDGGEEVPAGEVVLLGDGETAGTVVPFRSVAA